MPVLDIDMGNTRTKWRCGDEAGALASPELPRPESKPDRVRVATVLNNHAEIGEKVRDHFDVVAEFATTSAALGGVRCGYEDPSRLGVDRWLSVVCAWQRVQGALAVVSLGTAATVDAVDPQGRHRGGYIAPGLRLLADSLGRRTADVRPTSAATPETAVGRNTQEAVAAGTFLMLAAYVDAALDRIQALCPAPVAVFVSGGDAPLLLPRLPHARHVPDLVLDGLAIALP